MMMLLQCGVFSHTLLHIKSFFFSCSDYDARILSDTNFAPVLSEKQLNCPEFYTTLTQASHFYFFFFFHIAHGPTSKVLPACLLCAGYQLFSLM
jgi:hypothetical protein